MQLSDLEKLLQVNEDSLAVLEIASNNVGDRLEYVERYMTARADNAEWAAVILYIHYVLGAEQEHLDSAIEYIEKVIRS
jgi:hypothetical protein